MSDNIIDTPDELQRFLPMLHELDEEMKKRGSDVLEFAPVMSRRHIEAAVKRYYGRINSCVTITIYKEALVRAMSALMMYHLWVEQFKTMDVVYDATKPHAPLDRSYTGRVEKELSDILGLEVEDVDFDALCREFPAPKSIEE